jgi:hypothetical protein
LSVCLINLIYLVQCRPLRAGASNMATILKACNRFGSQITSHEKILLIFLRFILVVGMHFVKYLIVFGLIDRSAVALGIDGKVLSSFFFNNVFRDQSIVINLVNIEVRLLLLMFNTSIGAQYDHYDKQQYNPKHSLRRAFMVFLRFI